MDERRESRIPRIGVGLGFAAGAKPLETSRNANTSTVSGMDRKRKAETSVDASDAKRPTITASQGSARPTRSNTTGGVAGRSATLQHGTSARSAPSQSELPSVKEEREDDWEAIRDRTGQSETDVLDKKVSFPKGVKPERKVEALVPMVKELKVLGKHLLVTREKLATDLEFSRLENGTLTGKVEQNEQKLAELSMLILQQEAQCKKQEATIAGNEHELGSLRGRLAAVQGELERANTQLDERTDKVKELEANIKSSQQYHGTLQSYNTQLQTDLNEEKAKHAEDLRAKAELQGQAAELAGSVRSMEQMLLAERELLGKMREERETAIRDVSSLRLDLDNTRAERERAMAAAAKAKEDLERLRAAGGKSLETVEALTNEKATMEAQLALQAKMIASMREELAAAKEGRAMADATADSRGAQNAELKAQVETLKDSLAVSERRIYEGELMRRKLHNIIQDLKGNIRVYCRVRPVSAAEHNDAAHDSELSLDFPTTGDLVERGLNITVPSNTTSQPPQKHNFAFDRVFLPDTTQETVFDEISELVQSALDGQKVCIFAYGQTGSGKTFTMMGNRDNEGVIPRALKQIFESGQRLATQGWKFKMQASMLEIYNDDIRDLLRKRAESRKEDSTEDEVTYDSNGVSVHLVDKTETVKELLDQAMKMRTVGCTQLNEQSSRSHMVFTMRIEGSNESNDKKVLGVLNMIDLAGSERVKDSGATGQRLKEAQFINSSLSALGNVIVAISNKQSHVPFRDSKLTFLLQPCLGGDSKTLMFLNVAPTRRFAQESLCSLRFGAKVNACEINAPKKNVVVPRG